MILSDKTKTKLYSAISDPIMDQRVKLKANRKDAVALDLMLFKLEQKIWQEIKTVLKLE